MKWHENKWWNFLLGLICLGFVVYMAFLVDDYKIAILPLVLNSISFLMNGLIFGVKLDKEHHE